MSQSIVLLTDFGIEDPYVGQMKGVIRSHLPQAGIIDLSHEVRAHSVMQAGFFLAASWPYVPPSSLCVAVVDPGVGTGRGILFCRQDDRSVLAPDNGLLSLLWSRSDACQLWRMDVSSEVHHSSSTFHGRDLFVPLACRLAQGQDPDRAGERVQPGDCVQLPLPEPASAGDRLRAAVVHVDRFGNCVLNLRAASWPGLLPPRPALRMVAPGRRSVHCVSTYAHIPEGEIGLLAGSQGFLELAADQMSCARILGVDIGSDCVLAMDEDPAPGA